MNDIIIERVINSVKQYYIDLGWSENHVQIGMAMTTQIYIMLRMHDFPMANKEFPEVLRATGNMIELMYEELVKEQK